jgi:hypothetical protein
MRIVVSVEELHRVYGHFLRRTCAGGVCMQVLRCSGVRTFCPMTPVGGRFFLLLEP